MEDSQLILEQLKELTTASKESGKSLHDHKNVLNSRLQHIELVMVEAKAAHSADIALIKEHISEFRKEQEKTNTFSMALAQRVDLLESFKDQTAGAGRGATTVIQVIWAMICLLGSAIVGWFTSRRHD